MRILIAVAFATLVFFVSHARAAAAPCGAQYFEGTSQRLRSIESVRPSDANTAVALDRELAALVAPDAPLWNALREPCPAATNAIVVRDLARQRVTVLWARMLSLRSIDTPIYAHPYPAACFAWDVRSWQVAFIAAWAESVRALPPYSSAQIARAIANDAEFPHVAELERERSRALRVGVAPASPDDAQDWLLTNERLRDLAAPSSAQRCGPQTALWALDSSPYAAAKSPLAQLP